jgi:O-antigen ligase
MTVPAAKSPPLAGYYALRWLWAACLYLFMVESNVLAEEWTTVFLFGLGIQALVGVGQVLRQGPLGLPGELALEPAQTGAAILEVNGQRWLRAYGLTFHPNVLGGFLAAGILLAMPLLKRWRVRLLWWVLVLGLLLTFSRSAWLATAVSLPPLAGWLSWRKPGLRTPIGLSVAGAVLVALLGASTLSGQFQTRARPSATVSESRSLNERAELIAIALNTITDRPVVGVGAGNFPLVTLDSKRPVAPQPVHNVPMLLAAEVGIVAAALWLWLWLRPGIALENLWRRDRYWPVVLIAVGFAIGVIGLWDDYPWALESGRLLTLTVLAFTSRELFDA